MAVIMTSRKGCEWECCLGCGGDCYSGPHPTFERQPAVSASALVLNAIPLTTLSRCLLILPAPPHVLSRGGTYGFGVLFGSVSLSSGDRGLT